MQSAELIETPVDLIRSSLRPIHTSNIRSIRSKVNRFHPKNQEKSEAFLIALISTTVKEMIVTVDGPSGTGKSTVSKAVASRAGLPHLDTGAFYRAATLAALREGIDLADSDAVVDMVSGMSMDQDNGLMFLDGEDVSTEVRGERVTNAVSQVASHPEVRRILVSHQRGWVAEHGGRAVVEGRDIGSVVFPAATLKIYLDARPKVRAMRRATQVGEDPERTIEDLARRDHLDATRDASPLTIPDGAVTVDTSDLTFDQVVERVLSLISAKS